jgi:hypothetical protein
MKKILLILILSLHSSFAFQAQKTSQGFQLSLDKQISSSEVLLSILDMQGRVIHTKEYSAQGNSIEVNGKFPLAAYVFLLKSGNGKEFRYQYSAKQQGENADTTVMIQEKADIYLPRESSVELCAGGNHLMIPGKDVVQSSSSPNCYSLQTSFHSERFPY